MMKAASFWLLPTILFVARSCMGDAVDFERTIAAGLGMIRTKQKQKKVPTMTVMLFLILLNSLTKVCRQFSVDGDNDDDDNNDYYEEHDETSYSRDSQSSQSLLGLQLELAEPSSCSCCIDQKVQNATANKNRSGIYQEGDFFCKPTIFDTPLALATDKHSLQE